MKNWEKVTIKIRSKQLQSKTWYSDQKSLLQIIEAARELGVDPVDAERASISNLRTIISIAKDELKAKDPRKGLTTLFKNAAELTTSELRLCIGIRDLEEVSFEKVIKKGSAFYQLLLTQEQFDRVKKNTRPYYLFKENDLRRR